MNQVLCPFCEDKINSHRLESHKAECIENLIYENTIIKTNHFVDYCNTGTIICRWKDNRD